MRGTLIQNAHLCLVFGAFRILFLFSRMARGQHHSFCSFLHFLEANFFVILNVLVLCAEILNALLLNNILHRVAHLPGLCHILTKMILILIWTVDLWLNLISEIDLTHFLKLVKTFHHIVKHTVLIILFGLYWNLFQIFLHWWCIRIKLILMDTSLWHLNLLIIGHNVAPEILSCNEMLLFVFKVAWQKMLTELFMSTAAFLNLSWLN